MVRVNPAAVQARAEDDQLRKLDQISSLFDDNDDDSPDENKPVVTMADTKSIVINPVTCAMIDLADKSPEGIDRIIECLADVKAVIGKLSDLKWSIDLALSKLADRKPGVNTTYVRGAVNEIKLVYPSRSFNDSSLKKFYAELTEKAEMAESKADKLSLIAARNEFLRINSVAVNMKEFKKAENLSEAPDLIIEVRDRIARCEEKPYEKPTITIETGKGEPLGDSPIIVTNLDEEDTGS